MRVTDKAAIRQFMFNNNNSYSNMVTSMNKIESGKDFFRASEDSIRANKAMKIRKNLENLDMYDVNLKNANEKFSAAESNLYYVADNLFLSVNQRMISVQDTYQGMPDVAAIGVDILQSAEDMLLTMNADFYDVQLFAGTSDNPTPFTVRYFAADKEGNYLDENGDPLKDSFGNLVKDPSLVTDDEGNYLDLEGNSIAADNFVTDEDGKMIGIEVYDRYAEDVYDTDLNGDPVIGADGNPVVLHKAGDVINDADGNPVVAEKYGLSDLSADTNFGNPVGFEFDKAHFSTSNARPMVYYNDIPVNKYTDPTKFNGGKTGIYIDVGYGVAYNDDMSIDPNTAMDIALNGAKCTGCGTDEQGDSMNIIQTAFDAAWACATDNREMINRLIDKFQAEQATVLNSITRIGTEQNNIEFQLDKNETYRMNLDEAQNETEYVDLTEELINYSSASAAYNACLSLGAKAVPQSIFDFI